MEDDSFTRYLEAKRSVDDRALNHIVWSGLRNILAHEFGEAPVNILEIGAGTGTMLRRLAEQGMLHRACYHAIDAQAEQVACAQERMRAWAEAQGYPIDQQAGKTCLTTPQGWLEVTCEQAELDVFIERWCGRKSWDVIIANAFLDLVNIPLTLPRLLELACPGGAFLFTINFDGLTVLEPAVDPALDDKIMSLYHRSMDERVTNGLPSGDSRAGRHLFTHLRAAGYELLEAGSSDWVVFASDGEYPDDEAYFLRFMLRFVEETLRGHPELDPEAFNAWLAARRAQIERGELVLVVHQMDFLARRPTL